MRQGRTQPAPPITLERRRSDFDRGRRSTVLQAGCCCCCCCLHWVGAAVGGLGGLAIGWNRARRSANMPLHPGSKQKMWIGFLAGLLLAAIVAFVLYDWLVAIAWVPVLALIPAGCGMIIGAVWARRSARGQFDPEGIYCRHCLYDVRASLGSGRCPECGYPTLPSFAADKGMDTGVRTAIMTAAYCVGFSALGMGIGWLLLMGLLR